MLLIVSTLVWLHFVSGQNPDPDPCLSSRYMIDDGGRSSSCSLQYRQCDRYIYEAWYHVITEQDGDLTMATSCVSMFNCGAVYPIWMNGALPNEGEGIVNRTVCVSTRDSCCKDSFKIQVKNCRTFYAYFLTKSRGCTERYCFGNSTNCPTTTTAKPTTTARSIQTTSSGGSSSMTYTSTIKNWFSTVNKHDNLGHEPLQSDEFCASSFAFMALSACLLGTTVGLAVNILLRQRRDRRVDDLQRAMAYHKPFKA